MDNKEVNKNLIEFWNNAINLSEDDKKEYLNYEGLSYKDIIPAEKLELAVIELKDRENLLDYGCGNAWASIAAIKNGCQKVTAVDVGENIINSAKFYAELFKVESQIDFKAISVDWLKNEDSEKYDGLICSNVLDVVPLETSKEIIQQLARVLAKDAKVVIGLNFYLSKEMQEARQMKLEENCLFVNGVLRLMNLSDEEWKELFNPYFEVVDLDYFAWPNEPKETRRLFKLRRR